MIEDDKSKNHDVESPFQPRVIAVDKPQTHPQTEEYRTNLRLSRTVRSGDDCWLAAVSG
jgi:hypothetical protein